MVINEQNEKQNSQQATPDPIKKSMPGWLVSSIVVAGVIILGLAGWGIYLLVESGPDSVTCIDQCGDNVCQDELCQKEDCSCSETIKACPEDCEVKDNKIIYAVTDVDPAKHRIFAYNESSNKAEELTYGYELVRLDESFAQKRGLLLLKKDNRFFEYDISSQTIKEVPLRELKDEGDTFEEIGSVNLDISGDNVLIRIDYFDKNSPEYQPGMLGPQPVSYTEYRYNFDTQEIEESNIIRTSGVNGIFTSWYWDSGKDLVYSYYHGEGPGCTAPVTIYNLKTDEFRTQEGFDEEVGFYCPSFNNDFSRLILVPKSGLGKEGVFSVYDTENINEPILSIDLNETIESKPENWYPYSITWSNDNKRIYLAQDKDIYEVDLEKRKSRLVYKNEDSFTDYHNFVAISDDDKYLYINNITGEEDKFGWPGGDSSNLTRINLETGTEKVLTQYNTISLIVLGVYR